MGYINNIFKILLFVLEYTVGVAYCLYFGGASPSMGTIATIPTGEHHIAFSFGMSLPVRIIFRTIGRSPAPVQVPQE